MMNKFKYPRGSEWRKWDLQIHTPFSILNNQFGNPNKETTWDKYVNEMFRKAIEKNINVIGITDYFMVEGCKKIKNEYLNDDTKLKTIFANNEIEKIKRILILPNIEFRLNKFVGRDSINFHVIFSDEIPFKDIEENFLHDIDFVYEGNPQSQEEKWKLKIENLSRLGDKLKSEHSNFENQEVLLIGMKNAVVDDSQILEVLNKKPSIFKDKFLIILPADEDLSRIDWNSRDHNARKVLIQKSDIIFASNENTREWALGHKHYRIDNFINEFKSLKSCIWSSDAHSFDRLFEPDLRRYTWIKSNPTYEGLKQIIYEPDLRVKIQEENPRENEVYARIEKCIIDLPSSLKIKTEESNNKTDFCLSGKYEIEFSNNLTCIIGGRGIGKSTIVHLLYNKCEKKDTSRLDRLNSPLLKLDLSTDSLSKVAELTTAEIPIDTEFFLQNEIEKFARDIDEMSKLLFLRSSLGNQESLKDLEKEWLESLESMNNLIDAYDAISDKTKNIKLIKKKIATIKNQIDVIQSNEYKIFQREINSISNNISQFKQYKKEYKEIISKIDFVIIAISKLNWNKEKGNDTICELAELLKEYEDKLQKTFSKVENDFKAKDYSTKLDDKKQNLTKYLERRGLKEENIEEIANASERITELEDEIRELEKQQDPHKELYAKKESILIECKNKYNTYKNRFFEVAEDIEKDLEGLPFFDKEIKFTPKTNEDILRKSAVEFIKNNNYSKMSLRIDDIQTVLFSSIGITEYLKDKNKIRDSINKCDKAITHTQILQELINDDVFLEKLYLLFWKEYYNIKNIQIQTKLGDNLLQNTSFGERCGIVISIILIAGTNPIIIDQPEDNLDGKFISNILVPLIKKRKFNRQIILITRDANIVIGGDAELIHILEQDKNGKKTKILPTTIENIEYREDYIWILDGGKEAFEKREKKYGF
jgi:ABC-type enterochelin transport system ATPase subunit/predicted  nucleic acid-binding Zn-ribbon protein